MKCEKAQELFSDYLEGNLERPMAFTLEHHLSECHDCELGYTQFKMAWTMLDELPEIEVPVGFRASVMERIEAQETAKKEKAWSIDLSRIFGTGVRLRPVAAGAAVALFAVMLALHPLQPSKDVKKVDTAGLTGITISDPDYIGRNGNFTISSENRYSAAKSGLTVQVKPLADGYNLHFIPEHGASINVKAYAFDSMPSAFDSSSLSSGIMIMDQKLSFDRNSDLQTNAGIILLNWQYDSTWRSEVLIMPRRLSESKVTMPFSVSNEDTYEALQKIANDYGVIIFADTGLQGTVKSVDMPSANVDGALDATTQDLGINWRPMINAARVTK